MGGERRRRRHRRVVVLSEVDRLRQEQGEESVQQEVTPPRALPNRAREDSDDAWGAETDSNDRRLEDDVPPHWGRH